MGVVITTLVKLQRQNLPDVVQRYGTFLKVYKERWQDILKFREKNLLPVS